MTNHPDNRMRWVRMLDAISAAPTAPTELIEAEFASEVRLTGEVELADGALFMRPLTFTADDRGFYKYVLRQLQPPRAEPEVQEEAEPEQVDPPIEGTPKGYLFPGGPIGEILALVSLQLQTRVFLTAVTNRVVEGGGVPLSKYEFRGPLHRVDPRADAFVFDGSARPFADAVKLLSDVRRLPEKHHLEIAVAAGQYARALRTIGDDEEQVYIYLVSAVERLCQKQRVNDDPLQGLALEQIVRTESLKPDQIELLKQLIRYRLSTQRFVAFLQEHSDGFIEPGEPSVTQVTLENLPAVANTIYGARSKYLHEGVPMYISHRVLGEDTHMDGSIGTTRDNRRYTEEQKLPRVDFFHRLVRHCILHRLAKLIQAAAS